MKKWLLQGISCLAKGLRNQAFHEFLWFCAPALAAGLALRAALMISMPYGYIQYDSADFLTTPYHFIARHALYIHDKRSYLTPLLFSIPFLFPLPALIMIAVAQHVMGLGCILLAGGLVRFWFQRWRWFIIPVTVLIASSPWIVWYEHTIMGEAQFLFFTLLMVFAGTIWARHPGKASFGFMLLSLFLVVGTRLEAKLFFAFGMLLALFIYWKQWKRLAIYLGALCAIAFVAFAMSGKRDASALLYASLIQLTPDHPRSEPGVEPAIIPLRDKVRTQFPQYPADLVRLAKDINIALENYVDPEKTMRLGGRRDRVAVILKHLVIEAVRAHPLEAVKIPLIKCRLAIDAWSSYIFDKHYLIKHQTEAATAEDWMTPWLSKGLTGRQLDNAGMARWIQEHYHPAAVAWFTRYQTAWNNATIHFRTADKPMTQQRWVHDFYGGVPNPDWTLPGIPFFYIVSLAGMLVAMVRGRMRAVHLAWIPAMLGVAYISMLVAVTNGRFRFVYEPFCVIYFFLFLDAAIEELHLRFKTMGCL